MTRYRTTFSTPEQALAEGLFLGLMAPGDEQARACALLAEQIAADNGLDERAVELAKAHRWLQLATNLRIEERELEAGGLNEMIDATESPSPGRGLAARGREERATARLEALTSLSRREAHALGEPVQRARRGRKRPRRARSRIWTREVVASIISAPSRSEMLR